MSDTRLMQTIERAIVRSLGKMEDETGKINDWKAGALASYVVPDVLRAVSRQLAPKTTRARAAQQEDRDGT